ncbi:hypothetical protein CIK84_10355 [Glutamicibacter arilaitensis]|uniref:Uncharacterized protein n=1 Tax=Glutamicibacter arilaitensis TaxID=256701 RepID=A0A2N7S6X2_9MICC|nr:hypothetical protein CIK84_10355 [Glutamicibacter arilaitensis]
MSLHAEYHHLVLYADQPMLLHEVVQGLRHENGLTVEIFSEMLGEEFGRRERAVDSHALQ